MTSRLRRARAFVARRLRPAWLRRIVLFVAAPLALLLLLLSAGFIHHVYFDRSGLPDIEPFIRFEPPTTGKVYDARGQVLIELAREYRRVVSYDQVPVILRQAILAAEDKNFFTHSGVEYRALPRVVQKTAVRSLARVYQDKLVGPPPHFPREIEEGIDGYLATQALLEVGGDTPPPRTLMTASSPRQ